MVTWSESEEQSFEEENENKVVNICFMAIKENDEVNPNSNYEELKEAFEELYVNLKKLGLKNAILKKKISSL